MTMAVNADRRDAVSRHDRFSSALLTITTRSARSGPRALLVLGAVLQPLGGALILLGWSGAAGSTDVWEQIPYLISGGLLGLALVVAGGFCYFSYWQTEHVHAARRQAVIDEGMLEALRRIEGLLAAEGRVDTRPGRPPARSRS
jgi:hypothetical protein